MFPRAPRRIRTALLATLLVGAIGAGSLATASPASAAATPVMGSAKVSAADLASWFRSKGKVSKATVSIDVLAGYFIAEGAAEGVAGDLAFAQSIVETGYFGFSSRVPASNNNFSGLGAVDGGTGAAAFPDARTGVRAQIQHLRAYADPTVTTAKLASPLVDPRFSLVAPKGKAPTWDQFGGGIWASDPTYASKVLGIYQQILDHAGVEDRWAPFASPSDVVVRGYADLLARPATPGEVAAGATALEGGVLTPPELYATLVEGEGAEHGQPVARLYLAALGRLPDPGGQAYWTRRHVDRVRLVRLAEQFVDSSEFARRYGEPDDAGFVDLLYRNVLGRGADAAGADYWLRRLSADQVDRKGLVVQFSESSEHITKTQAATEAAIVYLGLVRRAPDPSVLSLWATKRSSGSLLVELTDLVMASSAYTDRISG